MFINRTNPKQQATHLCVSVQTDIACWRNNTQSPYYKRVSCRKGTVNRTVSFWSPNCTFASGFECLRILYIFPMYSLLVPPRCSSNTLVVWRGQSQSGTTPPWRIRLKARVDLSDQTAEFIPFEVIRTAILTYFHLFLRYKYTHFD
jgi:hypothetical protein